MTPPPASAPSVDSGVMRSVGLRPQDRYRALIETLPDVLVSVYDADLRVLSLEGGGVSRLPFPASTAIGRRLDEFLTPERVPEVEPHLRATLRGEPTQFEFLASNGVTWWIQVIPMVDDEGRVTGGMQKWQDITARRDAERALAAHARDLERSNAELEQFVAVASHDLSEPLRMVSAYLTLLQRRCADALDDDGKQFVAFALDGAHRMRELIEDLLAYSRLGQDETAHDPVDLQVLVESTWRLLTSERGGPEPTLLATGLPVVLGDAGQLGQVFQNLLANALKFTEPGRSPVVEVCSQPLADGGWALTVQDEGIGFDADQAERMFRMFQRLHTRDEFAGTGVGLAVARKVVEGHGGRIWAEPRAGGGARFRIELPAAA